MAFKTIYWYKSFGGKLPDKIIFLDSANGVYSLYNVSAINFPFTMIIQSWWNEVWT